MPGTAAGKSNLFWSLHCCKMWVFPCSFWLFLALWCACQWQYLCTTVSLEEKSPIVLFIFFLLLLLFKGFFCGWFCLGFFGGAFLLFFFFFFKREHFHVAVECCKPWCCHCQCLPLKWKIQTADIAYHYGMQVLWLLRLLRYLWNLFSKEILEKACFKKYTSVHRWQRFPWLVII